MHKLVKNEEGKRYGLWRVLFRAGSSKRRVVMWRCICDCGTVKDVAGSDLRNGSSTKCRGCGSRRYLKRFLANLTTSES